MVYVEIRSQDWMSSSMCLSPFLERTWHSVRLSGQQAPEILSASLVAGTPGTPPALVVHMSTGDPNSSPRVCMTGNVTTEPAPSSQVFSFYLQI